MTDIRDYSLEELEGVLEQWQMPLYHAKQVFSWIYQKGVSSFDKMTNLSVALRNRLKEKFTFTRLELVKLRESGDGTKKFIFRLGCGNFIESVLIPAQGRYTVCVSSQVGCKYGCRFCASGLGGFKRNLETGEILTQLLAINYQLKNERASHVVFMGTGEPLDNYDNVIKALRIINAKEGLRIGARRITISTSGVIPGIERLAKEDLQIELSVSLHASDNATRAQLMPINKQYPLQELIAACKKYALETKRQVTFEYVLIREVNCSDKSAQDLVKLLEGWNAKVNLLVYNPVKELSLSAPHQREAVKFRHILEKGGLIVTLRKSRGQDIEGACGQLRVKYLK